MKDAFSLVIFLIVFAWFVFYIPNYLGPRRTTTTRPTR